MARRLTSVPRAVTSGSERPKRERNPEQTRKRILDAAEHEFAHKGYDGARLRDVAIAAGVHHALLHHYFGDKEGLFRAVIARFLGSISSRGFELLRTSTNLGELIERYVDTVIDFYAKHREFVLVLHFATLDEGSPAFTICEELARTILLPLLEETTRTVERAQREGVVPADMDARHAVAVAAGAAAYLFHDEHLFRQFFGRDIRDPSMLSAHKKAVIAVLRHGLMRG